MEEYDIYAVQEAEMAGRPDIGILQKFVELHPNRDKSPNGRVLFQNVVDILSGPRCV